MKLLMSVKHRLLKSILILAAAGLACGSLLATSLGLATVKQPIFMLSDADSQILILDIPVASSGSSPEGFFPLICAAFVPPTDGTWKERTDINIASKYGIKVEVEEGDTLMWKIIINASAAK